MSYRWILGLVLAISWAQPSTAASIPEEGLMAWFAADTLAEHEDGQTVQQWPDRSPRRGDAVQEDTGKAPLFRANRVNGLPTLAFDGSRSILDLPGLRIGYEYAVYIVSLDREQIAGESVHRALLGSANNPYQMKGDGYGFGYYTRPGKFGTTVVISDGAIWQHLRNWWNIPPTDSFEILAARKVDDWVTMQRNGWFVAERPFDRPADAPYAEGYTIGGIAGQAGRSYIGEIAEILVYDGPLTDAEHRQVQTYLSEKYDIPVADPGLQTSDDPRFFDNGVLIHVNGYNDQPYITKLNDGSWFCVVTTAAGHENDPDRHLATFRSFDQGQTWERAGDDIEPPEDMRQPSWATLFTTPFGRVYAFYNINPKEGQVAPYVFNYSDDNGGTWNEYRTMPRRDTAFEERFPLVRGWSVDQPIVMGDRVFVAYSKYQQAPERHGEGWVFTSDNLLTERDPDQVRWEMWPEGDHGIRNDALGPLQEEHNLVPLNEEGSLYVAFRTLEGYVGDAYSRDGGRTWQEPQFAVYADGERRIKHTRALARVWKTSNGKYLMWIHNHDGRDAAPPRNKDRNPAWLIGGVEREGRIYWSEPEVLFFGYIFKHDAGMSYPDLVEEDGSYWISATDKVAARIHKVDNAMLERLWSQRNRAEVPVAGRVVEAEGEALKEPIELAGPLPIREDGMSVSLDIEWADFPVGTVLLDGRDEKGAGFRLFVTQEGTLALGLNNGRLGADVMWDTDAGLLVPGQRHRATFTVDGQPRLITVMIDGRMQDGGEPRQYGWTFFTPKLEDIGPGAPLRVDPDYADAIHRVRLYNRPLTTSETVGMYRADRGE